MAELSVLICTLNDRIQTVPRILLPECETLHYVVSFQYTDPMFLDMIPEELSRRSDVTLLPFPDVGLSANRNNALRHCSTPYAIISDDDTPFTAQLYHDVLATFHQAPQLDLLVFGDNRLALRPTPRMPQFDTRFGLGSAFLSCGEEEVFIHQAHVLGLNTRHTDFPSYPAEREPWSLLPTDTRIRRSWGALQYMKHTTVGAFARIIAKALFTPQPQPPAPSVSTPLPFSVRLTYRWRLFRDLLDGLRYIITHPLNDAIAEEVPLDFQPIDIWRMP